MSAGFDRQSDSGVAEVVGRHWSDPSGLDGRKPVPAVEIRTVERAALRGREHQTAGPRGEMSKMLREHLTHEGRDGYGPR